MSKGHIFRKGVEVLSVDAAGVIHNDTYTSGVDVRTVLRTSGAPYVATRDKVKQHWVVRDTKSERKVFHHIDRQAVEMWLVLNN